MKINEKLTKDLRDKISNMTGKILWTNPNPDTVISESTDITLSSDDYDVLEFVSKLSLSNNYLKTDRVIKGYSVRQYYGNSYRAIDRNSDTSYTIQFNNEINTMIPIYIIGYKTGLFN